jgi:DnaJ-class molecular chaperone
VPEDQREAAEQKFMAIAQAYEILSDDELRAK